MQAYSLADRTSAISDTGKRASVFPVTVILQDCEITVKAL